MKKTEHTISGTLVPLVLKRVKLKCLKPIPTFILCKESGYDNQNSSMHRKQLCLRMDDDRPKHNTTAIFRGKGGGANANKGIVQSPLTVNRALVVLRPCQQFFRYIIGRTLCFNEMMTMSVFYQTNTKLGFHIASSLTFQRLGVPLEW